MVLEPRLGVVGITPHVRDKGTLRHFNATTTEPTAQGLVDVFPTPGDHVVIVATGLLESWSWELAKGGQGAGM